MAPSKGATPLDVESQSGVERFVPIKYFWREGIPNGASWLFLFFFAMLFFGANLALVHRGTMSPKRSGPPARLNPP